MIWLFVFMLMIAADAPGWTFVAWVIAVMFKFLWKLTDER